MTSKGTEKEILQEFWLQTLLVEAFYRLFLHNTFDDEKDWG